MQSHIPLNKTLQAFRPLTRKQSIVFKHCKDAETTGHIDTNGHHKEVIASIDLLINHMTRQIQRSANKSTEATQMR